MLATLLSATIIGLDGRIIRVEVDVAPGLPGFTIVGLADAALQEARERVRGALRNAGFVHPPRRITVNLAPADLRKAGASLDLAIAIGILLGSEQLRPAGYIRYVDDFVLFADDSAWLMDAKEKLRAFLISIRLRLHPHKTVVSRTTDGVRFLGYRVFPDRIRLPRENVVRWRRKLRAMQTDFARGELDAAAIGQRIASWHGHASHADAEGLQADILDSILFSRAVVAE